MNVNWNVIMDYKFEPDNNSQTIYDSLFKEALTYKLRGIIDKDIDKYIIDPKIIDESIFRLTSHDLLTIYGKSLDGQKFKELFIVSLFLKHLENQSEYGDKFSIATPAEGSPFYETCDIAVIIEKYANMGTQLNKNETKICFAFQIKEYYNFKEIKQNEDNLYQHIDIKRTEKLLANAYKKYSEFMILCVREPIEYDSKDAKEFFIKNSNCCIIFPSPFDIEIEHKPLLLDDKKHNYIIIFSNDISLPISFDIPKCLKCK
jgi:hypothetical protein